MNQTADLQELQSSLSGFESAAFNFGIRFIPDSKVRSEYVSRARATAREILAQVQSGKLSSAEGAKTASELRNVLMDALRGKSSDIGRAYALSLKLNGKTLTVLEQKYSKSLFGKNFIKLSASQKNRVWKEIVFASGRPQIKATKVAKTLAIASRGLIALTITISVYNIVTADDKGKATAREGAVISGGLLGSVAGGGGGFLLPTNIVVHCNFLTTHIFSISFND